MADMNSTATRSRVKRTKVCDALPAYGAGAGIHSFRHGLEVKERRAVDRALEIVGRALRAPGAAFASPDAVKLYIRLHIGGEPIEKFCALFLDSQNRALAFDTLAVGSLTATHVYPRELVAAAIRHNANAVILAHNHPSGVLTPSGADKALTHTLKAALALVDVHVLDHVIAGRDGAISMCEMGMV